MLDSACLNYFERPFDKYRHNKYSQNGEDGVISEILCRIGARPSSHSWCVEFGAWDGKHLSNTFALVENGWNAIYIEGDRHKYKDLLRTCSQHPLITPIEAMVNPNPTSTNSLDNLLSTTSSPARFDILSIDIDSNDLDI